MVFICTVPMLGQISIKSKLLSQSLKLFSIPLGSLFPNSSQMWLTRLTFLKLGFHCVLQLLIRFSSLLPIKWDNICQSPLYVVSVKTKSKLYLISNNLHNWSFRKAVRFSKKILGGRRCRFYHLICRTKSTYLMGGKQILEAFCKLQSILQINQCLIVPTWVRCSQSLPFSLSIRLFPLPTAQFNCYHVYF